MAGGGNDRLMQSQKAQLKQDIENSTGARRREMAERLLAAGSAGGVAQNTLQNIDTAGMNELSTGMFDIEQAGMQEGYTDRRAALDALVQGRTTDIEASLKSKELDLTNTQIKNNYDIALKGIDLQSGELSLAQKQQADQYALALEQLGLTKTAQLFSQQMASKQFDMDFVNAARDWELANKNFGLQSGQLDALNRKQAADYSLAMQNIGLTETAMRINEQIAKGRLDLDAITAAKSAELAAMGLDLQALSNETTAGLNKRSQDIELSLTLLAALNSFDISQQGMIVQWLNGLLTPDQISAFQGGG